MISKRYWGGIPLGRRGGLSEFEDARFANTTSSDLFIYNHYNIEVLYEKNKDSSYNIVRFIIAPYSMDQRSITSCLDGTKNTHTIYEEIHDAPIQRASGNVPFTYDVQWVEYDVSHKERWNVYLSMGDAVPNYVEFLGFFLGGLIFVILVGVLYTWVMRDLSYKPVVDEADVSDEEAAEVQMWPLSTRIFFPPRHAQIPLCVACGTGAQLCVSGFLFVFLFRCGIISQSQGAKLLTPGAILYAICSPIGGYVTARLYAIFHGDRTIALALSLMTAITFPLLGIFVVLFVYDIFPDDNAPEYMAMSSSVPLILVWIFFVWPLTVAGGYLGHRGGAIQNFPVSAGSAGYQDLALQDSMNREEEERRARGRIGKLGSFAKKYRAAILFLTIGILPVLSCFVSFSYGVAAPIFLGAYSVRSYLIASFGLFILNSGAAAALMYYRQIRVHHFDWWWTSFASGTSAGFYIFLLLVSWLLFRSDEDNLTARTKVMYLIWFLFIAIGAGLASGCIGVAACIWFNKALYTFIMRKQ
jgi:transmembrane 9 superfamily protein 2/4